MGGKGDISPKGRPRMRSTLILTLTGQDRIGLVEDVTRFLLDLGGNVETSRMARLGGEFAILMLVSVPAERLAGLEQDVERLAAQGLKVTISRTEPAQVEFPPGWRPYQIEVHGADHEGIVHEIARALSQWGINIESLDTGTTRAPVSGTPLFSMTAAVAVPPSLPRETWEVDLERLGQQLNVEIRVSESS